MNPFQLICIAGILAAVTAAVPIFPPETERLSGFGTTLRKDFCLFSEGSIITRFEDIYLRSDNGEGWKLLDLTAIHDGTGMAPNPSLVGSCLILQTYPPNVSYDNGDTWEHLCTETSLEPYYSTPSIWGSGDTLFWFTFASDSSPTDAPRAHIVCKAGPGQIARPVGGTVPMPTSALNGMLLIDFADGPATSKDLGTTWTPIPASAAPVYSWALHGINGSIAASLRSDTLGITYDSGASWHKAVPPFSAIGYTITATADGGTWFAWDQAGASASKDKKRSKPR